MSRRYVILAPDHFAHDAKTAHGVIRYGNDETVAVIDPSCAGLRVRDVVPALHSNAPIVSSIGEALNYRPTSLLIGTAPKGGKLPPAWRASIVEALKGRLEIVSGLHDMLVDDREFSELAQAHDVPLWDVRRAPDVPLFSGAVYGVSAPIVLAVGNDCAVGKMSVMLELARAASAVGMHAEFVPTGQTGILIAGWGICVDRVIADFATGAAETLVLEAAARKPDAILVEGQGGINHPAYAPVTLALLFGSAPDALILVADVARTRMEGFETPTLSYTELIDLHERICATVKPARVAGLALNTRGLSEERARAAIEEARLETGLPADDVVRHGGAALWQAVSGTLQKTAPRTATVPA